MADIFKHLAELYRFGCSRWGLHMRLPTTDQLRANLVVASLAATFLQSWAMLAIAVLGVPQSVFTSSIFRLLAILFVVSVVAGVHVLANASFHAAIEYGYARLGGGCDRAVVLSPYCPRRSLVALHLRFRARAFRVGETDYRYAAQCQRPDRAASEFTQDFLNLKGGSRGCRSRQSQARRGPRVRNGHSVGRAWAERSD